VLSKEYLKNYRINFRLAYPIMLGQVGHILTGIADNIMVGHISSEHLAAGSLGHSIYIIFFIIGLGLATGITPLVGIAYGEKNHKECSHYLKNGLVSIMFTGLVMTVLMLLMAPLLHYIGQSESVISLAYPYYIISSLSLIPSMLFTAMKQFTEGIALTKPAMTASILFNLVNVFLNYLLIYGNYGFPRLELEGAAWASFIARAGMGIYLLIYVFGNRKFNIYTKGINWKRYSYLHISRIFKLGLPISVQFLLEVAAFSAGALLMGMISPQALASHQIAISIATFTYLAASGIASAVTIRLSNLLGKGKYDELKNSGYSSFIMVLFWMGFSALLLISLRHILPSLFVSEQDVIELSANLLIIAAFFQIFDGTQVTAMGALRGLKDVRIPAMIGLFSYWILALPLGYVFAFVFNLGAEGIWYGYLVGLILAALLLYIRFLKVLKNIRHI
jgi:MATE family multidrug resistance protein